jgi:hypothetical protein
LISGLIVEIATDSQAEDYKKTPYFEDENFNYVSAAAKNHGFKIDKNAPWRFVADLDSKAMKKYMFRTIGGKKSVHNHLYFKTCEYDLDVFKHYAWGWYNQYVAARPMVQIIIKDWRSMQGVELKKCRGRTTSTLLEREVLTEKQAFAKVPNSKWVRLYAYTRAKETRKDWNQVKFDSIVRETLEYSKYRSPEAGMKHLYNNIKDYPKKQYSVGKRLTNNEIDAIIRSNINKGIKGSFNF